MCKRNFTVTVQVNSGEANLLFDNVNNSVFKKISNYLNPMCHFFPGPTPYLLISTWDKIHAVDLLTDQRGIMTSRLGTNTLTTDSVNMKLYFEDDGKIKVRDNNREDVNVIVTNANVEKMTVDWIGRRIFWTEKYQKRISVANLDGKERRVIANTLGKPLGIAVDPISG